MNDPNITGNQILDAAALLLLSLPIFAAVFAIILDKNRGTSVVSLTVLAVAAAAILSNCTPVATSVPDLKQGSNPNHCLDIAALFCVRLSECAPEIPARACFTKVAPQCTDVTGITDDEAKVCKQAIAASQCDGDFPVECEGIGTTSRGAAIPSDARTL